MNKILIIEDNESVLDNTSELLALAGYEVYTASQGLKGLEVAREQKPDLILCDIMMPELDGYGVMRAMHNLPEMQNTAFVFMTAKADREDFRRGMDLGADDYLVKPFTGDDLLRVVSTRLKKRHSMLDSIESAVKSAVSPQVADGVQVNMDYLMDKKSIKQLKKKDTLFMEGDTSNYLYYIVSGKIKTTKTNEWGKDYITEIYGQGDFFGYTSIFTTGVHQVTAVAIENSEIALIPKDDFFKLIHSNPAESMRFIKLLSSGFLDAEQKLLRLAYDSARKRVAEALLFIYKKYQSMDQVTNTFSLQRENLSALAGISPESVSRNLTDFKEEGLIEADNSMVRILDIKKLECIRQ